MKTAVSCILIWFLFLGTESPREKERINWLDFAQLSDSLDMGPGRKVLIFFHTDWCVYCRRMDKEVFTDPRIVELINKNYYAVRFDAESTDTVRFDGQEFINSEHRAGRKGIHEIARLLGHRGQKFSVPVTLVLDSNFHIKTRHFEYLSRRKMLEVLE